MRCHIALLIALVLFVTLAIYPASAVRENIQSWSYSGIAGATTNPNIYLFSGSTGAIVVYGGSGTSTIISNLQSSSYTYAAFDLIGGGAGPASQFDIRLYDSSMTLLDTSGGISSASTGRYEVKMIGMQPKYYYNGALIGTGGILTVNPSYFQVRYTPGTSLFLDNFVIAESDHHVIGSLPSNWSVQRNNFNPAASGTYALNIDGTAWVGPKNSNWFYIDADVDSQDGVDSETLNIYRMSDGTIVNSTPIDSSIPRHQVAYNVTDFLANPLVTDGQYSVGYSTSSVRDYFYVFSVGGALTFDRSTYNIGETGNLTWYLSPTYISTANFDYTYRVVDQAGNIKQSGTTAVNDADTSGTVSVPFTKGTYTQGVVYGQMIATGKFGTPFQGQTNILAQTAITLTDYVNFYGHVYNAQTAAVVSGAKVNISQAGAYHVITTIADGNYSITGFVGSVPITFNVTAGSAYYQYLYTTTPLGTGNISLDFSLLPSAPTGFTGNASYGVVRDTTYGNPIASATVYIENKSTTDPAPEYFTRSSNIVGYYQCDNSVSCNLIANRTYNFFSSRYGFSNSTPQIVNLTSNLTVVNFSMAAIYNVTVNVVDKSTALPIANATLIDSLALTYTTMTGSFALSYPYSAVSVTVSSPGYDSATASFIVDHNNMVETVALTKTSQQQLNTWYTPKQVRYKIVDQNENPLPNSHVSCYYNSTTLPSTDVSWLSNMYGISTVAAGEMVNSSLAMQGITGNDGYLTFTQHGSLYYDIYVTNTALGITDYHVQLMPMDNEYILQIQPNVMIETIHSSSYTFEQNSTLYVQFPNISYVTPSLVYQDTSGLTTKVNFTVFDGLNGTIYYFTSMATTGITDKVYANYTLINTRGNEYIWNYTLTRVTP